MPFAVIDSSILIVLGQHRKFLFLEFVWKDLNIIENTNRACDMFYSLLKKISLSVSYLMSGVGGSSGNGV